MVCEPTATYLRERFGLTTDETKQFRVTPYVSWHVLQRIAYGKTNILESPELQLDHYSVENHLTYMGRGCLTMENCEIISRNLRAGEIFVASFSKMMDESIVRYSGLHMNKPCFVIVQGGILCVNNEDTYLKLRLQSQDCFPMVCKSSIENISLDEARLLVSSIKAMTHIKKAKIVESREYIGG